MKQLFISNLPPATSEDSLRAMLSEYGTVRSMKLVRDIFSGQCKGFAVVGMEGHEAKEVINQLDGKEVDGRLLKVKYELKDGRRRRR